MKGGRPAIMIASDCEPLNLGLSTMITIDGLVDLVTAIAGKRLVKRYDLTKPQGVRGRNSDNSRLFKILGWEPSVSLGTGLEVTYRWIENEIMRTDRLQFVLASNRENSAAAKITRRNPPSSLTTGRMRFFLWCSCDFSIWSASASSCDKHRSSYPEVATDLSSRFVPTD